MNLPSNPFKLFKEGKVDEVLLELGRLEKERNLLPRELVLKGRCIQLGSGTVISDYKEADNAFRTALDLDPFYVPALLELGWLQYAVEDAAATAMPFFDQALEVCLAQLKEAIKGKAGCLEELVSSEAAAEYLRQIILTALKPEEFAEGDDEQL